MQEAQKKKIVFMGTSFFAARILKAFLDAGYQVAAVYTSKAETEVSDLAEHNVIPVLDPEKFEKEDIEKLKSFSPDLFIVASYGKILPNDVLKIPKFGALNVHPSLLPRFRGPSPIQNALLSGETKTGTTIILMNEKVDAGDILAQKEFPIDKNENYPELLRRAADISIEVILKTIPLWLNGKIKPKPQAEEKATYCQLIERSDGYISWNESAQAIFNRWRALTPWPGIYTFFENFGRNIRVKLINVGFTSATKGNRKIGEVFKADDDIYVMAGRGAIQIKDVQIEGKSPMDIHSFLNGYRHFLGSILK